MTVPIVVDTDIGSDVDDALALVLAVRHPDLELRAVTTVSSQPDVRAGLARRLLDLAGAVDVEVAVGRSAAGDDRNAIGVEHLEQVPVPHSGAFGDAVDLLAGVRGVALATIGQHTNVAAALARAPTLPRNVDAVTVMGGVFEPFEGRDGVTYGPERDWNLVLDPRAAAVSLSAGWRMLRYVPIDVTFHAPLLRSHVERLRGGDELCVLLADLVDGWRARTLPARVPDEIACFLHDPLTVACVTECEFIEAVHLPVTVVLGQHGIAHTVIDPTEGHPATVVRTVDAPAFADWLVDVLLQGG
jgi:purine nucleosidase